MDNNVPYFSNTSDDNHCVPASYKMILKYFLPDQDFSFDQIDQMLGKSDNGGAWAAQGHIWLADHGFDVQYWSLINWPQFISRGYDYLVEQFGREVADYQVANGGDFKLEQQRAAVALKKVNTLRREPQIADIIDFLNQGYLVRCLVNACKLNDEDGYIGHSVVVKGYDDDSLIIHNPGPPPLANQKVSFDDFTAAWAYPNASAKELDAIKLKVPK